MSDYYDVCYAMWLRGLPSPPLDSYEYLHLYCGMDDEAIVSHFEKQTRDAELDHYQKRKKASIQERSKNALPGCCGMAMI